MRILITDTTHPVLEEKLTAAGHEVTLDTSLDYESLLEAAAGYDVLVVRSKVTIDRRFLERNPHLRCIGRVGAGMETLDVEYAERLGIRCLNSPEGNRDAVAEHAMALILGLFNHIASADAEVRQGLWRREANRGLELKGRTVGIIGFGNMGSQLARRLQGFECRVLAYDKYKPAGYAGGWAQECSLEQLQQQCDVISLHVPLTGETHYMIDADFIGRCGRPFYLINTSRGAVVNTAELVEGLRQGLILGAALDVIEYEDMSRDGLDLADLPAPFRYLLQAPNTLLTPHVAGWTVESKYKLAATLADKILAHL